MRVHENPWMSISPEDYDRHMGHPSVKQHRFLADCFHGALVKHAPAEILVIGCGTGNGLEHIDSRVTHRTTVIDFNARFLNVVKQRFQNALPGLEVIHDDLHHCSLPQGCYSMVYAGLVFEFVQPDIVLKKIVHSLRNGGVLEVVMQLPSETLPTVSSTGIESMKQLKLSAKLVNVKQFCELCSHMKLALIGSSEQTLDSGKSFFIGTFKKKMDLV
jgi:ubiquinone/menaquinone biosynthesis C-methylase UbiE